MQIYLNYKQISRGYISICVDQKTFEFNNIFISIENKTISIKTPLNCQDVIIRIAIALYNIIKDIDNQLKENYEIYKLFCLSMVLKYQNNYNCMDFHDKQKQIIERNINNQNKLELLKKHYTQCVIPEIQLIHDINIENEQYNNQMVELSKNKLQYSRELQILCEQILNYPIQLNNQSLILNKDAIDIIQSLSHNLNDLINRHDFDNRSNKIHEWVPLLQTKEELLKEIRTIYQFFKNESKILIELEQSIHDIKKFKDI